MDVATDEEHLFILINWFRAIPALEQVPNPLVLAIHELREVHVDVLHDEPDGHIGCLQQQMHMVGHEAEAVQPVPKTWQRLPDNLQIDLIILVVPKDLVPMIAPARDMILGTWLPDSLGSCHDLTTFHRHATTPGDRMWWAGSIPARRNGRRIQCLPPCLFIFICLAV